MSGCYFDGTDWLKVAIYNQFGQKPSKNYNGIYKRVGVPVVFDYHHHRFCSGGLTEREALELAMSTWPKGIVPVVHYSESRSIEQEDDKIKPQAHSDYVLDYIDTYGNDVDIMIEAKHKELAVNKYRRLWTWKS